MALTVAQTCLCKLKTERGQKSFFKQIFMPYVPVYDKTKEEIISISAGKSVDMTDTNSWTQHCKLKLNLIRGREKPTDTLE